MKRLSLVVAAVALCAAPAWADLTMKMSTGTPGAKDRVVGTTYATADRLAMIWQPGGQVKNGSHMIFDAGKQTMWIIDDSEKSYMALDKPTLERMGQQMEGAMAQMKEAMAKMTPEQRAMMEKTMGKMMSGAQEGPAERRITKTGESRNVSGFPCTRYDVTSGKRLDGHLWVTPYSQVKITKQDMAVFLKMGELFKSMTSKLSRVIKAEDNPFAATDQIDGLPILNQILDDKGQVTHEVLIEAINHDAAPAGVFDLPAGYKQKEMPKPGKPE